MIVFEKTCFLACEKTKNVRNFVLPLLFRRQDITWWDCWIFSNLSNSRFRSLIGWIQLIKLRKREFDRLEKIQQSYQLTSCLSKMQRKNEVTIVFWFFHKQKNKFFFSKTLKISAPNSFFPKNDKNLLFNGGLFQQVLLTWNENLCERSKKIEVEDRIQKTDGEDEETVFGLPGAVRSLRIFEEGVVALVEEFGRLGKALKWKIYYFILFFLRKRRRWAFSLFKQNASGLGSTNLSEDSSV